MFCGVMLHDILHGRLVHITQGKANFATSWLLVSCDQVIELLRPQSDRSFTRAEVWNNSTMWCPMAPRPMNPIVLALSVEKAMADVVAKDLWLPCMH